MNKWLLKTQLLAVALVLLLAGNVEAQNSERYCERLSDSSRTIYNAMRDGDPEDDLAKRHTQRNVDWNRVVGYVYQYEYSPGVSASEVEELVFNWCMNGLN